MSKQTDTDAMYIVAAILWSRGSTSMEDAITHACELQHKVYEVIAAADSEVAEDMRKSKLV